MWSIGCVIAELITGEILFKGDKPHSQLVEIIKNLGTPSEEDIKAMNPNYKEFKFPKVKPQPIAKVAGEKVDPLLLDLLAKIFIYDPNQRLTPYQALAHNYFDELRKEQFRMPTGNSIPDLFNFSLDEKRQMGQDMCDLLIPRWYSP